MWNEVFSTAITNGIFATLFVALLVYELNDSRKREAKYQNTIESLSTKLSTVDEIKQDVVEIKECIKSIPKAKGKKKNEDDKVV